MKRVLIISALVAVLFLVIPVICVMLSGRLYKYEEKETVNVYICEEKKVVKMEKEQYIKEVVAAEMPAEFSKEALKAQTVAARTYMQKKINNKNKDESHKGADVCTDYKHCKAWISESERKKLWEEDKRDLYWQKISEAVEETKGEIITYEGEVISAVFHSTSSGKTENARDVWGKDVPYLKSVVSEGDELSPKFSSEFSCGVNEFYKKISEFNKDANINNEMFSDIIRSEAGGIISMKVYGVEIKGSEFRNLFNLRSTNIQFETEDDNIIMKVCGNGHGVGMSQYGAEFMGKNGADYREILKKYYSGTEITNTN